MRNAEILAANSANTDKAKAKVMELLGGHFGEITEKDSTFLNVYELKHNGKPYQIRVMVTGTNKSYFTSFETKLMIAIVVEAPYSASCNQNDLQVRRQYNTTTGKYNTTGVIERLVEIFALHDDIVDRKIQIHKPNRRIADNKATNMATRDTLGIPEYLNRDTHNVSGKVESTNTVDEFKLTTTLTTDQLKAICHILGVTNA